MPRTDMYFKVTVEHDAGESMEKIGTEIVRQIERIYVVRRAELSHFVAQAAVQDDEL
jgi:hypothetical protein